jgi:hypothetical protein
MADCEAIPRCLFFNDHMASMPTAAALVKERYCRGEFGLCARYMVRAALGAAAVPETLFPNQTDLAERLIVEGRRGSTA